MKIPPMKKTDVSLEWLKIGEVKPHPKNPLDHPPEQIAALAQSLKATGWNKPIVVDERMVILAGHGIHMAAQQLGMTEVLVMVKTGLTEAQKRAYRIADNKLAEGHTWIDKTLAGELKDLIGMGFDVSLTGFNPGEISALLDPPKADPTEPQPAALQPVVSRLGDLWLMGEHRLMCADATKPATFKTLMAGQLAACVFTDPPYGVSYEARSGRFEIIKGDDKRRARLRDMLTASFKASLPHTRDDAGWYIWHASSTREDFAESMRAAGLMETGYLIWAKPAIVLGWSDYRWAHEPCFYACRQGTKAAFYGDRGESTIWRLAARTKDGHSIASIGTGISITSDQGELYVTAAPPKGKKVRQIIAKPGDVVRLESASDADNLWEVSRDSGESIHPTQKPVALARRAIGNSTTEGQIVLDMFSGSASTIIAAEQTGRRGYATDMDPQYVDAGVRRWQQLTGKQAIHATEKKPYDAIAKARKKA